MKLSTAAIAFCPPGFALIAMFLLEPTWLNDWSWPACIALGAAFGIVAKAAARIVEPED